MNEELSHELYEKMKAEQEAYRVQLLVMPPEEILRIVGLCRKIR